MRTSQISISMLVLSEYGAPKEIKVYADSNNPWETICAGFSELCSALQEDAGMRLPLFGVKERYEMKD